MPTPWIDDMREIQVHAGTKAREATFLHKVEAELAELGRGAVVVEMRSQKQAEPDTGEARPVGVPLLHADVRHARNDQAEQVLVCEQSRRKERGQHVHL